jgi:hypothetical protein
VAAIKASLSLSLGKHLYAEAVEVQESGSTEQEWRWVRGGCGGPPSG